MSTKKEVIREDNRDLIISHLIEIERDLAWLARKTDIPYGTLYSCLVQKHFNVSKENIKLINGVLETDF